MSDYRLPFQLRVCEELDQYALLACQGYNFGNTTDWFGAFRGGLYGFYARIYGVGQHYLLIHSWLPRVRLPVEQEYQLASLFFHMDSAVECLAFALNALGFAAARQDFRDITVEQQLKKIAPIDIYDPANGKKPSPDYSNIFPSVQDHWVKSRDLIEKIVEHHDVSKHRHTILQGGKMRLDPPAGFYEFLGIDKESTSSSLYWPMEQVILGRELKKPPAQRAPQQPPDFIYLERVAKDFCTFINKSCDLALQDAKGRIQLQHTSFQRKG